MKSRGVTLVHSEDRGDMMIEERCHMMMMVLGPTHLLTSTNE